MLFFPQRREQKGYDDDTFQIAIVIDTIIFNVDGTFHIGFVY